MSRLAVVTGAARGIGAAMCGRLVTAGFDVVGVDVAADFSGVVADLTTDDGTAAVLEAVDSRGGVVGMLVNNAGITDDARLVNMSEEQFLRVIDVNLGAAYRLSRALAFADGAAIVNVASRAYLGNFGQFNYSMSKGALVGLTRALALEMAPRVRVNAVAPGLIGTEMTMAIPAEVREKMVAAIPLGRMGRPEEVAELIAFLASEAASFITGEVIVIGGGRGL